MKLPETYKNRITNMLGKEEAQQYFDCFNQPNYCGLRVNTAKISINDFLEISPFELKPVPWTENGFYYDASLQPAKHPYYFAGLYYLQEPSAMTPAAFLPVEKGNRVLDMCAAPGGKSTELGVKLNGTGILYANDISQSRARALLKNIELFGIKNSVVLSEPPEKLLSRMEGYFDRILIDAPCSGEGMFRKDPSIISNWEKVGTDYYAQIQRSIIVTAAKLLKPGGLMLYSTCTFSPEEDEDAIVHLLSQCPYMQLEDLPMVDGFDTGHPEWASTPIPELTKCRRLWPHKIKGEGHFLALLKKSENQPSISYGTYPYSKKEKPAKETEEFFSELSENIDSSRIEIHNGKCYYLPKDMANVKGYRILRSGIFLGEEKKNRFEPSQPLAVYLNNKTYKNCVNFSSNDERLIRYLKGETIRADAPKGYVLVCVDGYGLGWAKSNGNMLKNKYHTGWRWK